MALAAAVPVSEERALDLFYPMKTYKQLFNLK